jgi:UDP-N-acetylmuramate dehydrogenase
MTDRRTAGPDALAALVGRLQRSLGAARVVERAPLAPYTTWRVGGPADVLCLADRMEDLAEAAQAAASLGVPWRVLGRGSNVLVLDGGIDGLVIINRTRDLRITAPHLWAESGLLLSTLARRTATAGLAGLEWSAGIPGSVGGAVVSNAGAHGGQMADTLQRALLLQPDAACAGTNGVHSHAAPIDAWPGAVWTDVASLHLAYRHSLLREHATPVAIVLCAEFTLRPEDPSTIRARMDDQRRQRRATQPLAHSSAGSVFKNPPGESAARLIDRAGLKGLHAGGAQVSTRHANFMVTEPGATARDLLALIAQVQGRVRAQYGIQLTLEVQPIGRETTATI